MVECEASGLNQVALVNNNEKRPLPDETQPLLAPNAPADAMP
jgi:hypothetical protein